MTRTDLPPAGWHTFPTLLVLVPVAVAAAFVVPYLFALAAIGALIFGCLRYTRGARKSGDDSGLRYNLCFFAVRYLIPVGIAMTFYGLLSLYISWFGDSVSIGWLITMQRTFEDVSGFFAENLKLNEFTVFVILVVIYLLSCVLLSSHRRRHPAVAADPGMITRSTLRERLVAGLHRTVEVYGRYSGPLAAGLATLASFTLFGMQLGEPGKDLQLRLKVAQQGYAEIVGKTESAFAERVSGGLYDKIRDSFPKSYRTALTLPARINNVAGSVRQSAAHARSTYGISEPAVERTLRESTVRTSKLHRLESRVRVTGTPHRTGAPESLTPSEIDSARKTLDVRRNGTGLQLIREGHRNVTLQVEKLVSERITALTKPLIDAVPILEPLLQTFTEAVDKTVQERIGSSYDRIMRAAMRDPGAADRVVAREAKAVVAETNVEPLVERAVPRAEQRATNLRRTLSSLAASSRTIDRRVSEHLAARRSMPRSLESPKLLELPKPLNFPPYTDYTRLQPYLNHQPMSGRYGTGRITPPRTITPPKIPPPRVVPRPPIVW